MITSNQMIKIKTGDIINFSWNSWHGSFIKLHNYIRYGYSPQNKWTHSGIVVKTTKSDITVYEALKEGFVERVYKKETLNQWYEEKRIAVGTPNKPLITVKAYADKYLGAPYGWLDIFSIILYTLFGKLSFYISTGSKQLICSEAVARILYDSSQKKINFEKEFNKRYDLITPIDLYKSKRITWYYNLSQNKKKG